MTIDAPKIWLGALQRRRQEADDEGSHGNVGSAGLRYPWSASTAALQVIQYMKPCANMNKMQAADHTAGGMRAR